ncbi:Uncharacterized protein TCM_011616 [Theobroma cacao]|uniref:Uncharacterized protein n=1 Tax=Theobroma cacao TaxID=3641 RepID=A0A061EB07_THECC|nr:Uncharacterized protein TCM_011616 [Theobroma cacao]
MDVRFGITAILNSIFFLFFTPQPSPREWSWNLVVSSTLLHQFSILELAFLLLVVMLLLLFLFTSAEVPLNLDAIRIRLRVGDFSIALTISLVASLFLPPSLFWPVHILFVFSSPWHGMFFHLFKHFLGWFSAALRSVPTYFIIITQNEESSNSAPLQDDIELGLVHEQQNSASGAGMV